MADKDVNQLVREASCPICLDYFKDPVSTECGHNFCNNCIITEWRENLIRNGFCPQCRERSLQGTLRPIRQLENIAEIAKRLKKTHESEKGLFCEEHEEKLTLFCNEDKKAICVACDKSSKHQGHTTILIKKVVQKCKEQLQKALDPLNQQLKSMLSTQHEEERKIQDLQSTGETLRKRISTDFEALHQFLREEEKALLTKLQSEQHKVLERLNEYVKELSQRSAALRTLIGDIEKKLKLQDVTFMKDFESSLRRCNVDFRIQVTLPKFNSNEFRLPLQYMVWKKMRKILKPAPLTLDPSTAHSGLILSEDRTSLRQRDRQDFPNSPTGFAMYSGVLSSEGFSSGRHYWEVEAEMEEGGGWFVGAVRESVKSNRAITLQDGYWKVQLGRDNGYCAGTSDHSLTEEPKKIIIYLDYEEGQLSYYNADTLSHLHTYNYSFTEKMFPYFFTQNACIKIVSSRMVK